LNPEVSIKLILIDLDGYELGSALPRAEPTLFNRTEMDNGTPSSYPCVRRNVDRALAGVGRVDVQHLSQGINLVYSVRPIYQPNVDGYFTTMTALLSSIVLHWQKSIVIPD
jgi:hypothetical protein